MNKIGIVIIGCLVFPSSVYSAGVPGNPANQWPQWRGPEANGVARRAHPPTEWSETRNVRWKVDLPGLGHATPIVWGNKVIIQMAVKTEKQGSADQEPQARSNSKGRSTIDGAIRFSETLESSTLQPDRRRRGRGRRGRGRWRRPAPTNIHEFIVMALDRKNGKVLWKKTLTEELPHESLHTDATQASNSPVTDGKHLYAYFGSRGLYCLDMEGNLKWKKNFGNMRTRNNFGEGSSPLLHKNTLVVNWDHEGDSFIVALDMKTGEQLWKKDRDEPTSWATPIIVEQDGQDQVITAASGFVRAYDLETGKVVWQCSGLTSNVISSPVSDFGMIFAMSGHRGFALMAIRYAGASGDISGSEAVTWRHDEGTPYVPSPLLYDGLLYFLKRNNALLTCLDAKTGKEHYTQQRLEGVEGIYASPVGANGRVYITGRNGTTLVIKKSPKFEILATNTLDDEFDASAAIVDDELYLRGRKHLYCIARK
ncbi:MAG: PQQ-binding-like beta-propeller repeat protein [Phycisphaerae bacterium]